ncbi:hypothetical protein QCA50_010649 [Cerrena zonata]|uniref:Chromo domain-containing protein n=1 Tax=Cerrena zonata TaxID=2478898 RepID=A0AAW0GBH7_9APHY
MLSHFDWDEHLWAAIGPGSKSGLEKMLGSTVRGNEEEAMKYLHGSLHSHFTRLGITDDNVPRKCDERPSGLSMVDIEHSVCEYDKYCRARFPQLKGKRTEIKKRFTPKALDNKPYTADLPDKWRKPPTAHKVPKPPAVRKSENGEEVYEVSHIVAEREKADKNTVARSSTKRFLVRWKGWGPEDDWWMSEDDLRDAQDILRTWNAIKYGIQEGMEKVRNDPYSKTPSRLTSTQSRRRSSKF